MHTDNSTDGAQLVHQSLQRLASQSAACKLWSAALVVLVLAWAHSIRLGNQSMPWAVAPVLLLALADAAYATQAARLLKKFRQGKNPGVEELLQAHAPLSGAETLGGLAGLLSASVWPYYVALTGAFLIAGQEPARPVLPIPQVTSPNSVNRLSTNNPNLPREPLNPAALRASPINAAQPPAQLRAPSTAAFSPTSSARPKSPINTPTQSSSAPIGPAVKPPVSSTPRQLSVDPSPSSPSKPIEAQGKK